MKYGLRLTLQAVCRYTARMRIWNRCGGVAGIVLCAAGVWAEPVDVAAFGIRPDTGTNLVPAVRRLLSACTNGPASVTLPKGRYDFWPDKPGATATAFLLDGLSGVTLDGGGSTFVFHGLMNPFKITRSKNILLRNFSVDWERPFITQGRIAAVADDSVDLAIDRAQYPYVLENGRAWFTGEDWKRSVDGYNILYDKTTKEIVYKTRDNPLGMDFNKRAEEIAPGVVRFFGQPKLKPEPGTFIALNHGRYLVTCFEVNRCANVTLRAITVYHSLSHGVVASRTENLTLDTFNIVANEQKGRVFSSVADGFHLVHCKGDVVIENCAHTGLGDDFLNTHGCNCVVRKRLDDRTVLVTRAECTDAGDDVWLLRKGEAQRREVCRVAGVKRVRMEDKKWGQEVTFAEALPQDFKAGDFFENKTWNAALTVRHCRILKRHRARGLLVTTPEKVVIESNYFRTAGTAILIEGDTDHWFESGANRDVLIRDNVFEDCLTSGSETGGKWEWGEAIITITPSHQPDSVDSEPFHRNIRIEGNTFKTFDVPLVRARSVRGLAFRNNTVEHTQTYAPFAWQQAAFWFDGCREVAVRANRYADAYPGRAVWTEHMRPADLTVEDGRAFDIQERPALK